MAQPNILCIMTDQQRFDTIHALGNTLIHTPNYDRLCQRGIAFTNAYSPCPVCVPARYIIRTGCESPKTTIYENAGPAPVSGQAPGMEGRCGPYLARVLAHEGYRTFGIGKFHTVPWDEELGYEVHLHSEELYQDEHQRNCDAYAAFIREEHPGYDWIEGLMGERTEMYYMPQMSLLPADCAVEGWASQQAVRQIEKTDERPWFGFVSFVGPHPPCAPPLPYNRIYNPDLMPNPRRGNKNEDLADEQLRWMNYAIWAEDINDPWARALRARYYGELTYIDACIGKILDAVEACPDADNTMICFFTDHGDHLGDHHAWQKESYFEEACHIPFLLSWPQNLQTTSETRGDLVSLVDVFGIVTSAAGAPDLRDGHDILGMLDGRVAPRDHLVGMYGTPGTADFKIMIRRDGWKYIYMANGGYQQLFNLAEDPGEMNNIAAQNPSVLKELKEIATASVNRTNSNRALDGSGLLELPHRRKPDIRIQQFDRSRGVNAFPATPAEGLAAHAERQKS